MKKYTKLSSTNSRLKYIYDNYAKKDVNTLSEFVDEINKSYYKFDKYLFPWDLKEIYLDFFNNIEENYDIIDIGAGSGFSHNLISEIGYHFNTYFFIEPSTNMSNRYQNYTSNTLVINDYIENLWAQIKQNKNKKIFIMNAALHHIIDLDLFAKNLNDIMGMNDLLFIPHEPNNEFRSKFYHNFLKISNPKKLLLNVLVNFTKTFFGENGINIVKNLMVKKVQNIQSTLEEDTLELALQDLINKGIVNNNFTKNMIYAITDYGVFNNWKNIHIPEDWNEGFYTLRTLPKILKLNLVFEETYSYNYINNYPFFKKEQKFDKIFKKYFPNSGAILCIALKK